MKNAFIKVQPPHCPMPTISPFIWRAAAAVVALLPGCCVALRGVAA